MGVCWRYFFSLEESSLGLKLSLYPEFQLPVCPGSGLKVCVVVVVVVVLKSNLVLRFGLNLAFGFRIGPSRTIKSEGDKLETFDLNIFVNLKSTNKKY